jgi:hypothetical protein
MHIPDEANSGPGQSVAILGAALRFPGARVMTTHPFGVTDFDLGFEEDLGRGLCALDGGLPVGAQGHSR